MFLKKIYEPKSLAQWREAGEPRNNLPNVSHVKVLRGSSKWRVKVQMVERGASEGWLSLVDGALVIKTDKGDLRYKIVNGPGHYCCHDGAQVESTAEGLKYIQLHHKGEKSPDPNNPSGIELRRYYETCLED